PPPEPPKEEPKAAVVIIKKEEAPKPPPPVVTAKGELMFIIRPWAEVHVDGKKVGVTPLPAPLVLAAGPHEVRLINHELGKDVTRTVTVSANAREVVKEIFE